MDTRESTVKELNTPVFPTHVPMEEHVRRPVKVTSVFAQSAGPAHPATSMWMTVHPTRANTGAPVRIWSMVSNAPALPTGLAKCV